jgi:NADH-quinone oxidoreductase subunit L
VGGFLWKEGDMKLIDGVMVNGAARSVGKIAGLVRLLQTGYLYHYAFAMIIGLLLLISFYVY